MSLAKELVIAGSVEAADAAASSIFVDLTRLMRGWERPIDDEAPPLSPEGLEEDKNKWANKVMEILRFAGTMQRHMRTVMLVTIRLIDRHWHELPEAFRLRYDNNFQNLLADETDLAQSTYDNYANAIDCFVLAPEPVRPIDPVWVPVRDSAGNVVVEETTQEVQMAKVVFDPLRTEISKLNLLTSRARAGRMTVEDWRLLADPKTSVEQIKNHLYGTPEESSPPQKRRRAVPNQIWFSLEGPVLMAHQGQSYAPVAEFDWRWWGDSEIQPLMEEALRRLNIVLDEDRTLELIRRNGQTPALADPEL